MQVESYFLSPFAEIKCEVFIIELRVAGMDGTVVVWADKQKIFQFIFTAATQPVNMMSMTEPVPIFVHRIPTAKLALTVIGRLKLFHQLAISRWSLFEEIGSSRLCDSGSFFFDELLDGIFIVQKQESFQTLFGQESCPWLKFKIFGNS